MDFVVAVPSYRRKDKLQKQTLAFLEQQKVPKDRITIFLANQEEYDEYKSALPDYCLVVGKQSLSDQRLFISHYYPIGTKVVSLDDDIKKIKFLRPDLDFITLGNLMFQHCQTENLTFWGIYPVNNLYYCHDRVRKGGLYIANCAFGFISTHDLSEWLPKDGTKEEVWHTLYRIQKEGSVLRYEGACPDTQYYGSGGLSTTRTVEKEKADSLYVASLFPALCSYVDKKNGHPDVKIKRFVLSTYSLFPTVDGS